MGYDSAIGLFKRVAFAGLGQAKGASMNQFASFVDTVDVVGVHFRRPFEQIVNGLIDGFGGKGCQGIDQIMQIGMGFMASKTLLSAVELELFTELAKHPEELPALSARLGLHPGEEFEVLVEQDRLGASARPATAVRITGR